MTWKGILYKVITNTNARFAMIMKIFQLIELKVVFSSLLCASFAIVLTPTASAQKTETSPTKVLFMGAQIKPIDGLYIIRKDVNIRKKPKTGSKKVGSLKKGERISTVGQAKGGWVAYQDQGRNMGFVYESVLYPIIESALKNNLKGNLSGEKRPKCSYTTTFVGKSIAEGQVFQIGDYEIDWKCEFNGKFVNFSSLMFLTEGPYDSSKSSIHQITIDIFNVSVNMEEVLSTNFLYDRTKKKLIYDGVNQKRLANDPADKVVNVADVPDALQTAVQLAHEVWNDFLWVELFKK
jgi:hypothetical protein